MSKSEPATARDRTEGGPPAQTHAWPGRTDAVSGIGRAGVLAFARAREGADVAISFLDEHDDAAASARRVADAGRKAVLLPGDLCDRDHCAAILGRTVAELGRLDVLVLNGASFYTGGVLSPTGRPTSR